MTLHISPRTSRPRVVLIAAFLACILALPALAQTPHEHTHEAPPPPPLPLSIPELVAFVAGAVVVLATLRKALVYRPWQATAEELQARQDIRAAKRQLVGLALGVVAGCVLIPVYLPLHERLHHADELAHAGHEHEHGQADEDDHTHSIVVFAVSPVLLGAIGAIGALLSNSDET